MNQTANGNIKEYIQSIIIQHKHGTLNTKHALSSLITILKQHREYNIHVSLNHFKKKGLIECCELFTELIDMSDDKIRFLCDPKVCSFIAKIIAEYCKKEMVENEENKRNNDKNTIENDTNQKENKFSDDTNNHGSITFINHSYRAQKNASIDTEFTKYIQSSDNGESFIHNIPIDSESFIYNISVHNEDEIIKRRRSKTNKENNIDNVADTSPNASLIKKMNSNISNDNTFESDIVKSGKYDHDHDSDMNEKQLFKRVVKNNVNNLIPHNLIEYIDNDCINCYLDVLVNIFSEETAVFLLQIMHQIGMFELFYILLTEKMCILFNSIFKYKCYYFSSEKDEKGAFINFKEPIYEIQRNYFENQVVIRQKKFVDNKSLITKYSKTNEKIYLNILGEFFEKNGFFFIMENGIKYLLHVINFYFSNIDNFAVAPLLKFLYVDEIINEIQTMIIKDEAIEALIFYDHLLQNIKKIEKNEIIIVKLVYNIEFNRKLFKIVECKNKEMLINVLLLINSIIQVVSDYNFVSLDKIDLFYFFTTLSSEKNIATIFNMLNYDFERKKCLIYLINQIYQNVHKQIFYKMSYVILVRHIILKIDPVFGNQFLKDFLTYIKTDSCNFAKILFTQTEKRNRKKDKSCIKDDKSSSTQICEFNRFRQDIDESSNDSFDIKKMIEYD